MKSRVEEIHDLEALYFKQLRLLLSAEEVIAVKTPFFTDRAQDLQLKQVLRRQSEEGEAHAARLRDILGRSGSASTPVKCEAIYALFHEVEELVTATQDAVRDAVLIAEAQRIKHYEIAAYGAVRQFARVLRRVEDEHLLDESIHKKGEADKQLSNIAERVNPAAKAA
jgi:ferritin-like metal-binding protein YciE